MLPYIIMDLPIFKPVFTPMGVLAIFIYGGVRMKSQIETVLKNMDSV